MRAALLLNAIPGLAQQFRPVPRVYTRQHEDGTIVQCPCGRRPVLQLGQLHMCEHAPCWIPGVRTGCARAFIRTNGAVLVFNPERGVPDQA